MSLYLVARRHDSLHSVRAYTEKASAVANREAEVLRGAGFTTKVFLAPDLLEVVREHPSWFAEKPLPQSTSPSRRVA